MALRTKTQWWGVVLDAANAPELAHFYARLLDWQVFNEDEDGAAVAPSKDAGYYLACQTEEHYVRPVWPAVEGEPLMMMHLDIAVDDLDESVAHAVEAGAELASYQPQADVRVMLDPAGHPFCLYLDVDD
ncbi:MAG TPA: VOC family protein [Nocardioidaceae bacterium]|nr:VOC family protein [Nocardioidaceae bacterium]